MKEIQTKELKKWFNSEYWKKAVQEDGYALQSVRKQTDKICKLAVQENSSALQYVKDKKIFDKLN